MAGIIACERVGRKRSLMVRPQKTPEFPGLIDRWRPKSESNRRTRICNPLHNHSAIAPLRTTRLYVKKGSYVSFPLVFGAGNESRTRDLNLGKVALYQLSYSRLECEHDTCISRFTPAFVALTACLQSTSNQSLRLLEGVFGHYILERETRLELATSTLARLRSTN